MPRINTYKTSYRICHAAAKRLGYRLIHNTGRDARRGVPAWRLKAANGVTLIESEDMESIAEYLEREEQHF